MKKHTLIFILIFSLLTSIFYVKNPKVSAASFDPSSIISDATFTNASTMSVADIQNFLISKGSILATISSDKLGEGANGRGAAQIIYDAVRTNRTDFAHAEGYGELNPLLMSLNPQVILVTLQKEQSLITNPYENQTSLDWALGYGCPDGGGCNVAYQGFTNQVVYGAAQFMKNYYKASTSAYKPGQTYIFTNTVGYYTDQPSQSVYITNAATSSLYQYTPHVYNGNYNFWYFMSSWFADFVSLANSGVGLLKGYGQNEIYLYSSTRNLRWYISNLADLPAWGVYSNSYKSVPDSEVNSISIASGRVSRMVQGSGPAVYYMEGGIRYYLDNEALFPLYKVSWNDRSYIDDTTLNNFPLGPALGSLSKSDLSPDVYFISASKRFYIQDEATLLGWGFSWSDIQTIPQYKINDYAPGGTLGRIAKFENSPDIFFFAGQQRFYVQSEAILNNWGVKLNSYQTIGMEKKYSLPQGKNFSQVAKGSGSAVYFIENGKKRYINNFSRLSRYGLSANDLIQVDDGLINSLPTGSDL